MLSTAICFKYNGIGKLKVKGWNKYINCDQRKIRVGILMSDKVETEQIKYLRQKWITYNDRRVKP